MIAYFIDKAYNNTICADIVVFEVNIFDRFRVLKGTPNFLCTNFA